MRATKAHLMSAAVGRRHGPTSVAGDSAPAGVETIVLEDSGLLGPVLESDLVAERTLIFVPAPQGSDVVRDLGPGRPGVVGYDGTFSEAGAEFVLGDDFYLQIQNYAISEYMSVVGPTLIRVGDETDLETYLADAERALREGIFPSFLTNPVIQMADLPALGAGPDGDGPALRLYVRAAGEVSTSPHGRDLGMIDAGLAVLNERWTALNAESAQPCAVCLGGVLDEADRAGALGARPWLPRYLAAVEAIRQVRARRGAEPRVSGFGGRLDPALPPLDEAADGRDATVPLLLWLDEEAFVYQPGSSRIFAMPLATARLAEVLLAYGSVAAAAGHAPEPQLTALAAMFARNGLALSAASPVTAGMGTQP